MGCFLACFGSSKNRKRRKPAKKKVLPGDHRHGIYEALQPTISIKQDSPEKPINPISESREKVEEQVSFNTRKKVTFDLNVKAYEDVSIHETTNYVSEVDEKKEEKEKTDESRAKPSESLSISEDDSTTSSMGSYPSNHRYQNCRNSDDEDEEIESELSDLSDDDEVEEEEDGEYDDNVSKRVVQDESSESLFSLSESRMRVSPTGMAEEVNSPVPIGANPKVRDRSQYVHSVLNPVENLTQWKTAKARTASPLKLQRKENINLEEEPHIPFSSEPSFKLSRFNSDPSSNHSKPPKQEIAVDTSLSNWLVSSETTPIFTKTSSTTTTVENVSSNSPRSYEDRPILGALTVEELKQFSASTSPRRSPSRSPDEIPILGTVGSYWSHTDLPKDSNSSSFCKGIPNTTSRYREDKRVNWHSTPFETRLERALKGDAAEAYSS